MMHGFTEELTLKIEDLDILIASLMKKHPIWFLKNQMGCLLHLRH